MDSSFKIIGMLIVLTSVLVIGFNLLNTFQEYTSIKILANDLANLGSLMKSLKTVSSEGSWQQLSLSVPTGYSLYFNNHSDLLEVHGAEEFNISFNNNLQYSLNLSEGNHYLQLYYGLIDYNELKNLTVVFR